MSSNIRTIIFLSSLLFILTGCSGGGGGGGGGDAAQTPIDDGSGQVTTPLRTEVHPLQGGKELNVTLSNSVGVLIDTTAAEGNLTRITFREPTESDDLSLKGEEKVATLFELEFDTFVPDDHGLDNTDIIPQITVPKALFDGYDVNTLSIFRIADMIFEDEELADHITELPIQVMDNGDLHVSDYFFPNSITSALLQADVRVARAAQNVTLQPKRIRYVIGSFRGNANWARRPVLKQFVLDPSASIGRKSYGELTAAEKRDEDDKNITKLIVFVHGHNEMEQAGNEGATQDTISAPWLYPYKRDVWTKFYQNLGADGPEKYNCTAFYEYIYPTYRPIFTETTGVERLDKDFAQAINTLIAQRLASGDKDIDLYIVAHSMGGLVSRAGIQLFDSKAQTALKRLVTWGSPHWGSVLVSLRYILGEAGYAYTYEGSLGGMVTYDLMSRYVDKLALDTPGERDLRRANRNIALSDVALGVSFSVTGRIVLGPSYLWDKYNLANGTYLFNENLRLLNENDIYLKSTKYHAIYGITTKDSIRPIGTSTGAYLIRHVPLNVGADQQSDGASSLSSMSGDKIVGTETNLGDVDHEEYYTSASAVTNKKTLEALDLGTCDLRKPIASPPTGTKFEDSLDVSLRSPDNAFVVYSLNGSDVSIYTDPITLTDSATITAYADQDPYADDSIFSELATFQYTKVDHSTGGGDGTGGAIGRWVRYDKQLIDGCSFYKSDCYALESCSASEGSYEIATGYSTCGCDTCGGNNGSGTYTVPPATLTPGETIPFAATRTVNGSTSVYVCFYNASSGITSDQVIFDDHGGNQGITPEFCSGIVDTSSPTAETADWKVPDWDHDGVIGINGGGSIGNFKTSMRYYYLYKWQE